MYISSTLAEILKAPESQVVSQNQSTVSFHCQVRGEELEWIYNDRLSSPERNRELIKLGGDIDTPDRVNDEINSTINFPNKLEFNNTQVYCVSLNKSGTTESDVALMIIAGIAILFHYKSMIHNGI